MASSSSTSTAPQSAPTKLSAAEQKAVLALLGVDDDPITDPSYVSASAISPAAASSKHRWSAEARTLSSGIAFTTLSSARQTFTTASGDERSETATMVQVDCGRLKIVISFTAAFGEGENTCAAATMKQGACVHVLEPDQWGSTVYSAQAVFIADLTSARPEEGSFFSFYSSLAPGSFILLGGVRLLAKAISTAPWSSCWLSKARAKELGPWHVLFVVRQIHAKTTYIEKNAKIIAWIALRNRSRYAISLFILFRSLFFPRSLPPRYTPIQLF